MDEICAGLAWIGRIEDIGSISGADKIESVIVVCGRGGRWHGVAQKGQFLAGDRCRTFLPDAIVPQTEEFAFMARHKYRVRIRRFKGARSECLVMPTTAADGFYVVGDDITVAAGVTRHIKQLPLGLDTDASGPFPAFIPQTDEPNFQAVPHLVEALRGQPYYITEKADGTSATVYWTDDGKQTTMHVCSRRWEKKDVPASVHWKIARPLDAVAAHYLVNRALQFEIVGPKIQGNPMGVPTVEGRLFNVYDIEKRIYLPWAEVRRVAEHCGMATVQLLAGGIAFDLTDDGLIAAAVGNYPNGKPREGIVVRPLTETIIRGERLSFKVVNPEYED